MAQREETRNLETIPVGSLGIIPLEGCKSLGEKVDHYLVKWRTIRESEHKESLAFAGYQRDSYLLKAKVPRFGSGEAKGIILESVRGTDLYLLVDVANYSLTYSLCGRENHMSPDDHYQDLKRIIAAVGGKARRITVIMPFLYESRQHKRTSRESLDCAIALQELVNMGVDNIITFDAHDPRVQNAIPLHGFETVQPTYQFIKSLLKHVKDLKIDSDHMMVISPDEGGMGRAIYMANVLGLGWAATPAGLSAMKQLKKLDARTGYATDAMCDFLILNISSLQLIPVNIIAYRTEYGAVNPVAVVGPAILATCVSTGAAILFIKLRHLLSSSR